MMKHQRGPHSLLRHQQWPESFFQCSKVQCTLRQQLLLLSHDHVCPQHSLPHSLAFHRMALVVGVLLKPYLASGESLSWHL